MDQVFRYFFHLSIFHCSQPLQAQLWNDLLVKNLVNVLAIMLITDIEKRTPMLLDDLFELAY